MLEMYDVEARRRGKMKSDDRTFVLRPMEGKNPRDTKGNVDPRLFQGENNLHAIYDDIKGMWTLRYEVGGLPEALKQKFTTFSDCEDTVRRYFANRSVEIEKVID